MWALRKMVGAAVLVGLPLSFASGCAPGNGGGALTPVAVAPSASQAAFPAASADWRSATKTAQWLQFGYDAGHSGYNPVEKTITAKNVSTLQVAWNDQTLIQPGGIVVDRNVAYVDDMGQTNQGLYALNAATGKQKWYANLNLNGPWGSFVHAVSVVSGNVVVSPCSNGSSSKFLTGICGVNVKNGKVLWTYYCSQYQGGGCNGLVNGTSPALYDKLVYVQITQGVNEQPDTEALNPKDGAVVWDVPGVYHCPDAGLSDGNPLPAADGNVFAVLGCQGQQGATEICALSAASGSAAWCDQTPPYVDGVIAVGNEVYVAEPAGSNVAILALNAKTGVESWSTNLPGANAATLASAKGSVFVEDGIAGVFALSAKSGKTLWSYTANANIFGAGAVSVANGIVYTNGGGGNNGNVAIAAFDAQSGSVIWTSTSVGNGAAPATAAIVNGTVYTGCYTLCAFRPSSGLRRH